METKQLYQKDNLKYLKYFPTTSKTEWQSDAQDHFMYQCTTHRKTKFTALVQCSISIK